MDSAQLLLLSALMYGVIAVLSLWMRGTGLAARSVAGMAGMAAAAIGCIAAIQTFAGKPATLELSTIAPFGRFIIQMDGLSAFMVGMISLLAFATSLYSISSLAAYAGRSLGMMGFFNHLFIAAMLLVVTVANAFYFLIFWEVMTLASYFLIIFEHKKQESVRAGYIYFVVAHCGTALIMLAFLIVYQTTGSFDFAAFHLASLPPLTRSLVFLLFLAGFGTKAGVVPLHIWLPRVYPAAPSHVTALLSGVAIKTAIYGILRVCVDLLAPPAGWWGFLVLIVGIVSAVLGILYALPEHDLKRLLAYSSVENIGLILVGVGTGMVGMAIGQPILALVGLLAGLYHTLNHAIFKGLLFLGAGAVNYRTHTDDINELGGLARLMPWTSLAFLIGSISISAIPPFNGFVSEWFTYQSLFIASRTGLLAARVLAPIIAILLALASAVTAMCFVKAYGTTFTGPAHSSRVQAAREAPIPMLMGMAALVIGCIALGIGAPIITPYIGATAASIANVSLAQVANGLQVFPGEASQAVLSVPMIFILMAGLLVILLLVVALYGGFEARRRKSPEPWACGYGYSPQMAVSASSFALPMHTVFRQLYVLRSVVQVPLDRIALSSRKAADAFSKVEPLLERVVSQPIQRFVEYLGSHIQELQMGDIRVYCLYIVLTLAILLVVVFR